jgi:hypothetical protein
MATPNRCTMANDSLLHLQQQWQCHQCSWLVIVSLFFIIEMQSSAGIIDNLPVIRNFFAISQQQNLIDNGDFDIFYISHNNDNGGNETICTYLANRCNGIRPEDLLVGKISDNGISCNDWMKHCLLHQDQLQ